MMSKFKIVCVGINDWTPCSHSVGPDGFWCWATLNGVTSPKFRTPEELERWKKAGGPEIYKMQRRAGKWHAIAWEHALVWRPLDLKWENLKP